MSEQTEPAPTKPEPVANTEQISLMAPSTILPPPMMPNISFEAPEGRTKRHFSLEEDMAIKALVEEHGTGQWSLIASRLQNRTSRQVRDRWKHYLAPSVAGNQEWTLADDKLLISLVQSMGKQWAQITKFFPGRTDVHLKNHWNKLERHAKKISPQAGIQIDQMPADIQSVIRNLEGTSIELPQQTDQSIIKQEPEQLQDPEQ